MYGLIVFSRHFSDISKKKYEKGGMKSDLSQEMDDKIISTWNKSNHLARRIKCSNKI